MEQDPVCDQGQKSLVLARFALWDRALRLGVGNSLGCVGDLVVPRSSDLEASYAALAVKWLGFQDNRAQVLVAKNLGDSDYILHDIVTRCAPGKRPSGGMTECVICRPGYYCDG